MKFTIKFAIASLVMAVMVSIAPTTKALTNVIGVTVTETYTGGNGDKDSYTDTYNVTNVSDYRNEITFQVTGTPAPVPIGALTGAGIVVGKNLGTTSTVYFGTVAGAAVTGTNDWLCKAKPGQTYVINFATTNVLAWSSNGVSKCNAHMWDP